MTLEKYTGSVRGITFGVGQEEYMWGANAPNGLGIPVPQSSDFALPRENSYGGIDRVTKRILRIPITIVGQEGFVGEVFYNQAEAAEMALDGLKRAWRPSSDVVELDLRLSGDARRYFGRCRGLEVDVSRIDQGIIFADGSFDALEWLAYDLDAIESTAPDTSSPVVIPNPGTAATTRCVLTIVGNGGTPVIINYDDAFQGFIRFRRPLPNGQSVNINLDNFRIFNTTGEEPRESLVSPMSTFFVIEAKTTGNTVAFSGCASISYRVRPAYL